ncbi:hypothetical protein SAMN04488105_11232 [Salipiger thiooxidans]|uniref:Type IV pilus biogenesis protein PilP n=1 Tax=Salipiger thiooxidans TaxID=282683 RepID=A0A1G7I447_9RHOB|nr:hypothetical protein [Salipiger thiooxidans]SDF07557.1 hypothetical protein SAMN04488105_11232 [Salipiger thiooxidans]
MVPNFALSLSSDGITLLRRAVTGWSPAGDVALDSADLDAELTALRATAEQLSPEGAQVLLILPNEQIRYLDLAAPGDPAQQEAAVQAALDGATPYAVDELVCDWSTDGERLFAAAVARETLEEAAGFVSAHGFVPVGFTAMAPDGAFTGAPFFGAAPGWTGVPPDRLPQPVRIVAAAPVLPWRRGAQTAPRDAAPVAPARPEAEAVPEVSAAPAKLAPTPDAAAETPAPETVPTDPSAERPAPVSETAPTERATRTPATTPATPPTENAAETDTPAPESLPTERAAAAPTPPAAPHKQDAAPSSPRDNAPEPALPGDAAEPAPLPDPDQRVRFAQGVFGPGGNARADTTPAEPGETALTRPLVSAAATGAAPRVADPAGARPDPAPSFSTMRATRDIPEAPAAPVPQAAAPAGAPAPKLRPSPPPEPAADPTPAPRKKPAAPKRARNGAKAAAASAPRPQPAPPPVPQPAPETAAEPRDGLRVAALRRSRNEDPGPPVTASAAGTAAIDPDEERRRMTVFGARRDEQIGGKPRFLGLMLTVVLLLFLAAVAAWASVFLEDGISRFFRPDEPAAAAIATSEAPDDAALGDGVAIADEPEAAADAAETLADEGMDVAALLPPDGDAAPVPTQPLPAEPTGQSPSADEAAARYAATGIWERAPSAPHHPQTDSVDDLYIASVDPKVGQYDAVALPPAGTLNDDVALEPVRLPPGPDVRFDLDENGLVRATPEGAISPDGIRVFTGPPPQIPPQRSPAGPADEAAPIAPTARPEAPASGGEETGSEETGAATSDAASTDTASAEPGNPLAQSRPQPRPGDLVEQAERATLGGNSFAELAGKRPIERPAAISEAAQQQAEAAMAEAIAQQVAATVDTPPEPEAEPEAEADEIVAEVPVGTRLAVASSIQPKNRPRDIDTIVKRTESEPVRTASAATVRAQPAAPRIPQNSSVAGAATVKNQINLRQINLIGVFGTPSSRRALVRLSNGRLQNVKVGDRLDGGRVAAIGDTELQLNKNGRNVVLRMPNG